MKHLFFYFFILSFGSIQAQSVAKIKLKKHRIAFLENTLNETSGLCFLKKKLYSFNDGGNNSNLVQINPVNGKILTQKEVKIPNHDWEAIAIDSSSIYIGDFGNNAGTRKELCVYKLNYDNDSVFISTSKIEFAFENQMDFSTRNLKHDFDTESMIYLDGQLHLFSKEWISKKTSHYILNPNNPEKQLLKVIEEFDTGFMVTDACFYNNNLYLVGYTKIGQTFLLLFEKNKDNTFFSVLPKKYKLGSFIDIGQVEGIAVNENGIYISSEGISKAILTISPALYFISHNVLKNGKE